MLSHSSSTSVRKFCYHLHMQSVLLALFLHHFTSVPAVVDTSDAKKMANDRGNIVVEIISPDRSQSVARGAQRVPVLELFVQASCTADVVIQSIDIQRRGLGDKNDIQSLYVMQRNKKLSRPQSINRKDGKVQLRLRRHSVPACTSQTLTVHADFSSSASIFSEHQFILTGDNPISTLNNADVTISPAITTPIHRLVSSTKGRIFVSYRPIGSRLRFGKNRIVSRVVLEADSNDNHEITALTLTNNGTATNADLQNIYLAAGRSEKITMKAAQLDGREVRLLLHEPIQLRKGQKKIFTVRADINASRTKTIQLVIKDPGDIESTTVSRRR